MGGLIQPPPMQAERDNSRWIIVIAIAALVGIAVAAAFLLREKPTAPSGPPPYAANLKFSDLKMSRAQNFVGATVTYIDGTLTNAGDKTVTRVIAHVTFKDPYGQVAQIEDVPVRALQPFGPYTDAVDLASSPLSPGQSKPFRLTFEHVSEQWGQSYPDLQISDVTVK